MQATSELLKNFSQNIQDNLDRMEEIIVNDSWAFRYDSSADTLFFSPKDQSFSFDSVLVPTGEKYVSVRFSTTGVIEGIIVDGFLTFFVEENPAFVSLAKKVKRHKHEPVGLQSTKVLWKALIFDSLRIQKPITQMA